MTKTREELMAYYEKRLEKVIKLHGNDFKGERHIEFAKNELEEVKNGRNW